MQFKFLREFLIATLFFFASSVQIIEENDETENLYGNYMAFLNLMF